MNNFVFSTSSEPEVSTKPVSIFSGRQFYSVYRHAEFLRSSTNVETILSKGYEMRNKLKGIVPGQYLVVQGMCLEKNTPLMVKKTGTNINVEDYEFTQNRLTGLVAAYTFDNYERFPVIECSEASALGLKWNNSNEHQCKLYLSAVSGTEHFYDQFSYWPLVCALKKLELNKITTELVIKIAKIKNPDGQRVATVFLRNYSTVLEIWKKFPGSKENDLKKVLRTLPKHLKFLFMTDK